MDFIIKLLNLSLYSVIGFFGILFLFSILVGLVIVLFYVVVNRFGFKKQISLKTILGIFILTYAIICSSVIYCFNKDIDAVSFRYYGKYGYVKKKNFTDKIIKLSESIKTNPTSPNNYFFRGITYANNFYFNKALKDLNKALEINPNMPTAINYIAHIYIIKGKYDEAEEYCKKAIKLSPNFSKPYFNLAMIYKYKKDYDMALDKVNKSIECDSSFYEAYSLRSEIFLIKEKFQKAINDLEKVIELNPQSKRFTEGRIKKILKRSN